MEKIDLKNCGLFQKGFACLFLFGRLLGHWVLGPRFTYQKNTRTLKHAFFGVKPHGEQCLLKALCHLWENPYSDFEKKPFGLVSKVLEGR